MERHITSGERLSATSTFMLMPIMKRRAPRAKFSGLK